MPYALELVWHPNEFASPPFIPPRYVLVAVGGKRRPGGVVNNCAKEDKHMFRKLSQLRWFVLMMGMVMGMSIVGCAGTVSEQASVRSGRFSVDQPVVMTCSEATYHAYSSSVGGRMGRYVCREVKGPDGKVVGDLRLLDNREGHKVNCTEQEGKITCPNVPLAAFSRSSPWTFGTPGGIFPPIGAGGL